MTKVENYMIKAKINLFFIGSEFSFEQVHTVSAKFNRTRVQTAPVTLLSILQTRQWYQSKELGILLQKHPQHVKIEQFRPEKIEFKD